MRDGKRRRSLDYQADQRRRGAISVDAGRWSSQNNAVERPDPEHFIREAAALVDAAYLPLTAEHAVIDVVLVDAPAKPSVVVHNFVWVCS
jgi:hypothetical protein